jgi:hypothetical protein
MMESRVDPDGVLAWNSQTSVARYLPTRDGLRNVVTFFRAGPPKEASRATWRRADSVLRDWLRSRGLEVNAVERCSASPRGIETHMRAALLPHVESQSESPFAFGN